MTSIRTWVAVAALVVALWAALGYALWQLAGASRDLDATLTRVTALEASVAAIQARQKAIAATVQATTTRSIKTDERVSTALRQAAVWAESPVPAPVVDGLCERGNCVQ